MLNAKLEIYSSLLLLFNNAVFIIWAKPSAKHMKQAR